MGHIHLNVFYYPNHLIIKHNIFSYLKLLIQIALAILVQKDWKVYIPGILLEIHK